MRAPSDKDADVRIVINYHLDLTGLRVKPGRLPHQDIWNFRIWCQGVGVRCASAVVTGILDGDMPKREETGGWWCTLSNSTIIPLLVCIKQLYKHYGQKRKINTIRKTTRHNLDLGRHGDNSPGFNHIQVTTTHTIFYSIVFIGFSHQQQIIRVCSSSSWGGHLERVGEIRIIKHDKFPNMDSCSRTAETRIGKKPS